MQAYLRQNNFIETDRFLNDTEPGICLSTVWEKDGTVVIVDHDALFENSFTYKRYCQMQNDRMKSGKRLYRFVEADVGTAKQFLEETEYELDYSDAVTYDRESRSIDPTPLESFFELRFGEAYGEDAYKYLLREYSIIMKNGATGYVDYALYREDGTLFVIEENGVTYHHPFIIGKENYRQILMKQNSVTALGGKVFRWDTESIQNPERIVDEIKAFFGDIKQYRIETAVSAKRSFQLYEHQKSHLENLSVVRESGGSASVVVLPTGTGKTVIAIEGMKASLNKYQDFQALLLVPTLELKNQWQNEIDREAELIGKVKISTYAGVYKFYKTDAADKYTMVLVDEAHHAVAPTLRKVIRHYQPDFLLGLTATDKRLDEKQLSAVFGEYEVELDLKEAIEQKLLCQIRAFRLMTNIDLSKVRFNGKDYFSSDLEKSILVPSRNEIIADTVHKYFNAQRLNKSGIIFCINVTHAREMARLLCERGIHAAAIDGKDRERFKKTEAYMKQEIRFLCTCSLLTEGWDAPHTSVIVMARPTLSKVLYTQQLGRGTRNHPGKEALYVLDVVDNYGTFGSISNRPWSVHALLGLGFYAPFADMINRGGDPDAELTIIDTIIERELKLAPIDVFTMQQQYGDYLSAEQLARELFVSTGTVNSWVQKKKIIPDAVIPVASRKLVLFAEESVDRIRGQLGLEVHNEETIVDDFWKFIEEGDYTFSYKMYFVLALLENTDSTGDAPVDSVLERYQEYYQERFREGRIVDRTNGPYNDPEYVRDEKLMKRSMLDNPFEKFERKRFMYHAKDLEKISIHHRIWDMLIYNGGMEQLKEKMRQDLVKYYRNLENAAGSQE